MSILAGKTKNHRLYPSTYIVHFGRQKVLKKMLKKHNRQSYIKQNSDYLSIKLKIQDEDFSKKSSNDEHPVKYIFFRKFAFQIKQHNATSKN